MASSSTVTLEKTCSIHGKDGRLSMILSPKEKIECTEAKCELVGFDALPEYLRDNEFILDYYRSEWPWKQTLLSIFSIHNETLNIWTHLIGFLIFLALTVCAIKMAPFYASAAPDQQLDFHFSSLNSSKLGYMIELQSFDCAVGDDDYMSKKCMASLGSDLKEREREREQEPITRWPFYAYLCGAMLCLLTSSACHLLSCHSEHCAYAMLRLDYAGISTLIVTSFYPLVYYTFICDPITRNLYMGFITAFGVATVLVSLVPVFQTPEFRSVRALLFCCMAVSGLVPIVHKMVAFGERPEAVATTGYEAAMGVLYGLGVAAYATRVPERWMPGRFDLVGHSHQLFHVLVIAGAYAHYQATLVYLQWRDVEGC